MDAYGTWSIQGSLCVFPLNQSFASIDRPAPLSRRSDSEPAAALSGGGRSPEPDRSTTTVLRCVVGSRRPARGVCVVLDHQIGVVHRSISRPRGSFQTFEAASTFDSRGARSKTRLRARALLRACLQLQQIFVGQHAGRRAHVARRPLLVRKRPHDGACQAADCFEAVARGPEPLLGVCLHCCTAALLQRVPGRPAHKPACTIRRRRRSHTLLSHTQIQATSHSHNHNQQKCSSSPSSAPALAP